MKADYLTKLLKVIIQPQQMLPAIFFTFARRQCEVLARGLLKAKFNFNTKEEAENVAEVRACVWAGWAERMDGLWIGGLGA
eukprot:277273-Chlamydomonas_euryale.AAC.1